MDVACQCRAVSFKTPIPKPLAVYICHCDECQRQTGTAFGCSAIFPKFPLPSRDLLSLYSRPTASGSSLNCYFCKACGTRVIHSTPGKDVVSIKGGCIKGLDWSTARHIWCSRAVMPIPEGVERDDEEATDGGSAYPATGVNADFSFMNGSGGSDRDDEMWKSKWKGAGKAKQREVVCPPRGSSMLNARERQMQTEPSMITVTSRDTSREKEPGRSLTSGGLASSRGSITSNERSDRDLSRTKQLAGPDIASSIREDRERRWEADRQLEQERREQWEKEVDNDIARIRLEKTIEFQQKELDRLRTLSIAALSTDNFSSHHSNGNISTGSRNFSDGSNYKQQKSFNAIEEDLPGQSAGQGE